MHTPNDLSSTWSTYLIQYGIHLCLRFDNDACANLCNVRGTNESQQNKTKDFESFDIMFLSCGNPARPQTGENTEGLRFGIHWNPKAQSTWNIWNTLDISRTNNTKFGKPSPSLVFISMWFTFRSPRVSKFFKCYYMPSRFWLIIIELLN